MDKHRALIDVAARQGGYFTARQALAAGYSYRDQHYHTRREHWIRMAHGVYRLRDWPLPARSDLIILSLLCQDRVGRPQAVVSHESALAVHELSDANPARIRLTVPPGFRKVLPAHVVLHRALLSPTDWEEHEGYRVTTPYRTLLDLAAAPTGTLYLAAAVRDALQRGLIRPARLLGPTGDAATEARLREAVAMADRGYAEPDLHSPGAA